MHAVTSSWGPFGELRLALCWVGSQPAKIGAPSDLLLSTPASFFNTYRVSWAPD